MVQPKKTNHEAASTENAAWVAAHVGQP
jgi:hypothetical protein